MGTGPEHSWGTPASSCLSASTIVTGLMGQKKSDGVRKDRTAVCQEASLFILPSLFHFSLCLLSKWKWFFCFYWGRAHIDQTMFKITIILQKGDRENYTAWLHAEMVASKNRHYLFFSFYLCSLKSQPFSFFFTHLFVKIAQTAVDAILVSCFFAVGKTLQRIT